jgi:hypothetical protein
MKPLYRNCVKKTSHEADGVDAGRSGSSVPAVRGLILWTSDSCGGKRRGRGRLPSRRIAYSHYERWRNIKQGKCQGMNEYALYILSINATLSKHQI